MLVPQALTTNGPGSPVVHPIAREAIPPSDQPVPQPMEIEERQFVDLRQSNRTFISGIRRLNGGFIKLEAAPESGTALSAGSGSGAGSGAGPAAADNASLKRKREDENPEIEAGESDESEAVHVQKKPRLSPIAGGTSQELTQKILSDFERLGWLEDDHALTEYGNKVNKKYNELLIHEASKAIFAAELEGEIRFDERSFIKVMRNSPWRGLSDDHLKQLFYLLQGYDKPPCTVTKLAYCFTWLGDPALLPRQAIPAHLAIPFYYLLVCPGAQSETYFKGVVPRKQLDAENRKIPTLRLCTGRLSWMSEEHLIYLHRNMVLSDPENEDLPHELLWQFNDKSGEIESATGILKRRHKRMSQKDVEAFLPRTEAASAGEVASPNIATAYNILQRAQQAMDPSQFEALLRSQNLTHFNAASTAMVSAAGAGPAAAAFDLAADYVRQSMASFNAREEGKR